MASKPVANTGNSGRIGADKETEKLVKIARAQKWDVTVTGGNHVRWTPPPDPDAGPDDPKPRPVISGLTAGSYALPKLKSQLKRLGLHI